MAITTEVRELASKLGVRIENGREAPPTTGRGVYPRPLSWSDLIGAMQPRGLSFTVDEKTVKSIRQSCALAGLRILTEKESETTYRIWRA